ncbi:MAG: hypothetical protein KatS3mg061_1459 [Dehalococcoidia bacterium]|nr:MAG: hypothetical protein KatS3mg061_1459 [Dehalococcoidia bacterium]
MSALAALGQALTLSLAAHAAAQAGDPARVSELLEERTPLLQLAPLVVEERERAWAILAQIQRLDEATRQALEAQRAVLLEERAALRRAARLQRAYLRLAPAGQLDRLG